MTAATQKETPETIARTVVNKHHAPNDPIIWNESVINDCIRSLLNIPPAELRQMALMMSYYLKNTLNKSFPKDQVFMRKKLQEANVLYKTKDPFNMEDIISTHKDVHTYKVKIIEDFLAQTQGSAYMNTHVLPGKHV